MNWLIKNLQSWTPFSAVILLATTAVTFITVWDTIKGLPLPAYVVAILSLLIGGTGATQLVTHGSDIANGTMTNTAATAATAAATAAVAKASELKGGANT